MASVVETYTVVTKGKGAPDYSDTVSSSRQRAGIYLQYPQRLKMYGRNRTPFDANYPFIAPSPLAPGDSVHLTDVETLVDLPIIIPVGYTMSVVTIGHTVTQDARLMTFLDSLLAYCFGIAEGGSKHYHNELIGLSTALYDADASDPHTLDIKLFNEGLVDLYGSVSVIAILEAVGTSPLPTTKECQCPYCSNKQTESVHATKITCKNCGKLYIVFDLSNFRGTI